MEKALIISADKVILPKYLPSNITASIKPYSAASDILSLTDLEKYEIEKTLLMYSGNITRCAQSLGISRNTLYRKINRYRLEGF